MSGLYLPSKMLPRLDLPVELAVSLMEAAAKSLRRAAQEARRARQPRRGETLKPGTDTPLWNELVTAINTRLKRRGDKAKLARVLGLPRQRVNDLLRVRNGLPDAERTLLLLVWLQARNAGQDLC